MKTAIVTGGSRGIGYGIAEALAAENWNLAICARQENSDAAENLMKKFPSVTVRYYKCDVSDRNDRENLLSAVLRDFGSFDALINNAGVAPQVRADLLEMSEESFDRVMNINLKGPFFLSQSAARYFAARKAGVIVNIGSCSATVASISRGEYCISKAGIGMMTKLFAVKMAEFGVNVYEIRPGVISSDMTSTVKEKYDKLIAEGLTLQPRWGEPQDIGKAVAMLLRGDLAYSTGTVIDIGGGMEIARL